MRVITIVGKVDTRVIAYPIARALAMGGQTCILSEDAAYKRLYYGTGSDGNVNGIDIKVRQDIDIDQIVDADRGYMAYDNLIVVSNNFISKNTDGLIVCKGVNKSIQAKIEDEKEDDDEHKKEKKPKKSFGSKGKKGDTEEVNQAEQLETKEADQADQADSKDGVNLEKEQAEVKVKQEVTEDTFEIPHGIPCVECYISYDNPPDKGDYRIALRDGLLKYVHQAEENKRIEVYEDKKFNKEIAKVFSQVVGLGEKEFMALLSRGENTPVKKIK